jgi:hypothetical protein
MSQIVSLEKNEVIDNGLTTVDYFKRDNEKSSLKGYQIIIDKIKNAKEKVLIQSTRLISDEIIDALYQNDEIHVYMILKSFEESKGTVERFDKRKPAIIREVMEIENDFIIIDGLSYLFINPLCNEENIYIGLDEQKTKNLNFIFDYYFWNCASCEKLIDTISEPVESPFPPFGKREQKDINIIDVEWNEYSTIYIPRDKKFENILERKSDYKYFSDDIQCPVLIKNDSIQIGKLQLNDSTMDIENRWLLQSNSLNNIDINLDIIIKDREWSATINIKDRQDEDLGDIEAETIEDIETTKPDVFPAIEFIKEITYLWNVTPPLKLKESKRASLYSEYDRLDKEFNQQLDELERNIKILIDDTSVRSLFLGANRKASQNLKKVQEYKSIKLSSMNNRDLTELIGDEFKTFCSGIVKSQEGFLDERKKAEVEEKWNEEKEKKLRLLQKKESELLKDQEKLVDEKNGKQRSKITTNIKRLENEIDKNKKEITESYTNFEYKPKGNELNNLSNNSKPQYRSLKLPKYALPEVGELYETKDSYFLEILSRSDLAKANELKARYDDKNNYKVVVGDMDE